MTCCQRNGRPETEFMLSPEKNKADELRYTEHENSDETISLCQACRSCFCKYLFLILIFLSCLALLAAVTLRVFLGGVDTEYLKNAPLPTEQCIDEDFAVLCAIKGMVGMCPNRLCMRSCTGCKPYDEGLYYPKVVKVDEVEKVLTYARNGSKIPESLQGIWFMDQGGDSIPLDGDPSYPFNFNRTFEVLITFGDFETR